MESLPETLIARLEKYHIGSGYARYCHAAAAERERIAAEFDRRAVYPDGTPSNGWYDVDEPAEIIRGMK